MRVQLTRALAVVAVLSLSTAASADGTVEARTVYYKEKSTRVIQPMLDGMFDAGARGLVDAHLLVDAVTSASPGAGGPTAVAFSKQRYEGGLGYTHELDGPSGSIVDRLRLHGEGRVSREPDYRSYYLGGRVETDLAQKNATVGIGAGVMRDTRDVSDNQSPLGGLRLQCPGDSVASSLTCHLATYQVSAAASQIVSRNAVVSATYDVSYLDGYQPNPYRLVVTPGGYVPEKHPFTRLRQAIALAGRVYLPATGTTLIAAYRFYHDDWKINAHSPEVGIVQQVGRDAEASFRYRYYTQSASFFERTKYPDPTIMKLPYYTDDPKMTAFDSHLMEAKLGVMGRMFGLTGVWSAARFEGILEYVVQNNRFGNAGVAHVAVIVPFDY
jgi:hypothetical protein